MLDREAFLRAIYSNPTDDLPRLVFADFLQENGEEDWAELIRLQCELTNKPANHADEIALLQREAELLRHVYPDCEDDVRRGFVINPVIRVSVEELSDPDRWRSEVIQLHPEWYGATRLEISSGRITTPDILAAMMSSPVTENVTTLNLSGRVEEIGVAIDIQLDEVIMPIYDLENKPVITVRMVEALAQMRECRRLIELDLRNNDLDNDAVRALANSPHLFRLQRLYLLDGNRFKGRTWQAPLERFGPDVVQ